MRPGVNILPNKWMLHPGKIMDAPGRIPVAAGANRDFSKTFPKFFTLIPNFSEISHILSTFYPISNIISQNVAQFFTIFTNFKSFIPYQWLQWPTMA